MREREGFEIVIHYYRRVFDSKVLNAISVSLNPYHLASFSRNVCLGSFEISGIDFDSFPHIIIGKENI